MAKKLFYMCAGLTLLCVALQARIPQASGAASAALPGEVAVLTGTVADGETLPLPVYADGTSALEAECKWIVSINVAWGLGSGERVVCYTEGRRVHVGGTGSTPPFGLQNVANFMVIATRGAGSPTSARSTSWGALKASTR